MTAFVGHPSGVVRNLSQQIRDLIARDHTLTHVRIHVERTSVRCCAGHRPSKRLLVSLVQVHETSIAVRAELQSLIRVVPKFRPTSVLVHVTPIFLDIVGDAIQFVPEVPIGIIKKVSVCSDPVHGFHQFGAKEHFRMLTGARLIEEGARIVEDQIVSFPSKHWVKFFCRHWSLTAYRLYPLHFVSNRSRTDSQCTS